MRNYYYFLISIIALICCISCSIDPTSSEKKDNTPPTAYFSFAPDFGDTTTIFEFDASISSDKEDSTSALVVRWDWESDGSWDTGFLNSKVITHQFNEPGLYQIAIEVKDSGGLVNKVVKNISIGKHQPNDYFPLKMGNRWDYRFSYGSYDYFFGEMVHETQGTATIELLSINEEENGISYYLWLEKEGIRIDLGHNDSTFEAYYDTSIISIQTNIIFTEDTTGNISNTRNGESFDLFWINIPRYSYSNADTIELGGLNRYKVVKDIGIIYYYYDAYQFNDTYRSMWLLTNYDLK